MKLVYIANVSLDGFIEDASGSVERTAPDEEVFAFITDLVRSVGTSLRAATVRDDGRLGDRRHLAAQLEPMADTRAELELVDERRSTSGVVCLRYRNPT